MNLRRISWAGVLATAFAASCPLAASGQTFQSQGPSPSSGPSATVQSGDQLPNGVDYLVFDFAVNAGVQKAIQTLQKVLGVKTDGVIGPVTLTAIKEADPEELIREFTEEKENHYESLSTFETFGEGWMARSERVEQRANALCG